MTVSTTGCSLTDLTPTDAVRQCTERGFANTLYIPNGVVCYSSTIAGSEAIYSCNDGFHINDTTTRVCLSDGAWNGSIPQCFPEPNRANGTSSLLLLVLVL